MLDTLALVVVEEAEIAGIDFRDSEIPAADPSRDRSGVMDRRSFSILRSNEVPTNGR